MTEFTNQEMAMARHFHFSREIFPARTDSLAEAAMVQKLVHEEDIDLERAKLFVHDLVHVARFYTVTDGPAK